MPANTILQAKGESSEAWEACRLAHTLHSWTQLYIASCMKSPMSTWSHLVAHTHAWWPWCHWYLRYSRDAYLLLHDLWCMLQVCVTHGQEWLVHQDKIKPRACDAVLWLASHSSLAIFWKVKFISRALASNRAIVHQARNWCWSARCTLYKYLCL